MRLGWGGVGWGALGVGVGVEGLIPIEEMWHNKLKQRLVFWHRARHSSQKPKGKRENRRWWVVWGGIFFFGMQM